MNEEGDLSNISRLGSHAPVPDDEGLRDSHSHEDDGLSSSSSGSFVSAHSGKDYDSSRASSSVAKDFEGMLDEMDKLIDIRDENGDADANADDVDEDEDEDRRSIRSHMSSLVSPVMNGVLDSTDERIMEKFRRWIIGFVVLNFDLEVGQAIEFTYPPSLQLSEQEKSNIRFSSFPDSSSYVGDTVFSFRCRTSEWTRSVSSQACHCTKASDEYLYGYVFFRQKKDERTKRGYFQKSLAILSVHPYPGLYLRLVALLGRTYFDMLHFLHDIDRSEGQTGYLAAGKSPLANDTKQILENAFHQISRWPSPESGATLELVFDQHLFHVELPFTAGTMNGSRAQLLETSGFLTKLKTPLRTASLTFAQAYSPTMFSPPPFFEYGAHKMVVEQVLASLPCTLLFPCGFLQTIDTVGYKRFPSPYPDQRLLVSFPNQDIPGSSLGGFVRFFDILDSLWDLWELVLLGEPIVVFGRSQAIVSEVVWWLSDLIKPISYEGDFRPYFTIQDEDFTKFTGLFRAPSNSSSRPSFYQQLTNSSSSLRPGSSAAISSSGLRASVSQLTTPNHSTVSNLGFPSSHESQATNPRTTSPVFGRKSLASTNRNMTGRTVILGVTNPFFVKALDGWPHTLSIPQLFNHSSSSPSSSPNSPVGQNVPKKKILASHSYSASESAGDSRSSKSSSLHLKTGLSTQFKSSLNKDKRFIQTLKDAFKQTIEVPMKKTLELAKPPQKKFGSSFQSLMSSMSAPSSPYSDAPVKKYKAYVLNEMLRRHFVDLTERFLVPLNRYFATLIPIPVLPLQSQQGHHHKLDCKYLVPHPVHCFKIKPFDVHQFLQQLNSYGAPKLSFKSQAKYMDLYIKFLESPNFIGWLKDRKRVAERQLRNVYLDSLVALSAQNASISCFLLLRRELVWYRKSWDPVLSRNRSSSLSIDSLRSCETPGFLLINDAQAQRIDERARVTWAQFDNDIKQWFLEGEFDFLLDANTDLSDEDDFYLVQ